MLRRDEDASGFVRPAPRVLPVAAVLFDLDGTLADTAGDLAGALNRVRAERGLPPISVTTLRPHASSGARGLLGAGMGVTPEAPQYVELRDAFLDHYAACLSETTALFQGVAALLASIEARGLRWGIVTNKARRFTDPVVAALQLDARARVIVCGDTTPHPKPHPAPLLHAAAALELQPAQCIYVGDDLRDIVSGNAAGMATFVAEYGYMGVGDPVVLWPAVGWIATPLELLAWLPAR